MSDEALVLAVLHGLSIPEFRAEILTSLGKLAECEQCRRRNTGERAKISEFAQEPNAGENSRTGML
jgi:hypothetical protein